MGFLGWAWRDSFHRAARLKNDSWMLASGSGGVIAFYLPASSRGFLASYDHRSSFAASHLGAIQAPFFLRGTSDGNLAYDFYPRDEDATKDSRELIALSMHFHGWDAWALFLPYWLILLATATHGWPCSSGATAAGASE